MKLVIPMSGHGSRFKRAGYSAPKPLIEVDGKPIIAHVLDIFPGEKDVIFICSEEHLATTSMRNILQDLRPQATIVAIDTTGTPKGPIYPLMQAAHLIHDDEEVMVTYCDFGQVWDYEAFKTEVRERNVAGAIPSYTGFHPHLLRKQLYGGILADANNLLIDYREKHCFTENPEDSYHSGGAYYFKTGALLKHYASEVMKRDMNVGGEYYVSLPYYLMKDDGLPIYVAPTKRFMQWGTPEDLEEYEAWSRLLHRQEDWPKGFTSIPAEREALVRIPYEPGTREFEKSYHYWKEHFILEK